MRKVLIFMGCILLFGCKKDDPKPPGAAVLSFPLQSSECTTGVDLNDTTSQVEFRWLQAKNTRTYELRVTNMLKNVTQTISTQGLSAQLPLAKATPYSWVVVTRNSETNQSATSAQWQFYNAGTQTTYAPFPAQLVAPQSGGTAVRDINNDVELSWTGADVDNDIMGYEVYLSTFSPPVELIASPSVNNTTIKGSTLPNTVYYWKIITRDSEGNSSDSGTFSFKAL